MVDEDVRATVSGSCAVADRSAIGLKARLRASGRALVVCLAASGGGHVRQLLDLENVWAPHDYYFVTEDSGLSRSLATKHPVFYVSHVALGQARLGRPIHMALLAVKNFVQSARIVFRKRPDVVISTGAGAVFFVILWARLLGARVITIESFARFAKPSMFSKFVAPFSHCKIVQSAELAHFYPNAHVFEPLRILNTQRPPKKPLLFATVGATLPFDRLVRSVEQLKKEGLVPENIVIQTGVGGYAPEGIETHETLPFEVMQSYLRDADIVVCHAGTGSMITALRQGCRVIVMPRLFELGEHYDRHQLEITTAFAGRGLVQKAVTYEELRRALEQARRRAPVMATTDTSELASYLKQLLASLSERGRASLDAGSPGSTP